MPHSLKIQLLQLNYTCLASGRTPQKPDEQIKTKRQELILHLKWPIYPILAIMKVFLNSKQSLLPIHFYTMPVIRYNFRKIYWKGLEKSLYWSQKIHDLPHFGHNENTLLESKTFHLTVFGHKKIFLENPKDFYPFINDLHQAQHQM